MPKRKVHPYVKDTLEVVRARNHSEKEFLQAAEEVLVSLSPVVDAYPDLAAHNILERITEPERQIIFNVTWQDDNKQIHVNRGFRVGFNSSLGPFKGGLRFHPTVNLSVIKFLAFEQIFKNSLTGLQIGGGKGGSDFEPKGKSDDEIMRFCQAFMNTLYHYLGEATDVPAGDIGVGKREIGYLFGQYKRITNRFELGVLTGKDVSMGGSLGRTEATGFGAVYFAKAMLENVSEGFEGRTAVVSGSGNVAIYAIKKLQELGANVVACSDSGGTVYDPDGIDLVTLRDIKEIRRERLSEYAKIRKKAKYKKGAKVWDIDCELAFPCATQNELGLEDAKKLVKGGCRLISEGANMPTTPDAHAYLMKHKILYGPGKAANAGGVAVSALEMQQNASWTKWTFEEVDSKLQAIMEGIHGSCLRHADQFGRKGDYAYGANIGGFLRVAQAMMAHGHA